MDLFGNVGLNASLADTKPAGTTSFWGALENVGVLAAAGAAQIGLQSLAKSQGVQSSFFSPYSIPPKPLTPAPNALQNIAGANGGALIVGGLGLLGVGLIIWAALRKG